jgi:hypothetical protein
MHIPNSSLVCTDPPTVSILWNIKILITAVLFRVTFNKKFSRQKWLAVFLLLIGCVSSQADKLNKGCSTVVKGVGTLTDQLQCTPNVKTEVDSCTAAFTCGVQGADPNAEHTLQDSVECLSSFACKAERFAKNTTTVTAMMHSTHGMIRETFGEENKHSMAGGGQRGRWLYGMLLILLGTTVTSLAGVYSEWVLKDTKKLSFFLQNMQMNFWGVVFNAAALFALHREEVASKVRDEGA